MKHQRETHKVTAQQGISSMCLVCGADNDASLQAQFLELDDGGVMGIFQPNPKLQSYPDRLHGGASAAILDEVMGRTLLVHDSNDQAVTMELNLKFRKPVPLDRPITAIAHIEKIRARVFDAVGQIVDEQGDVAVEAKGRFIRVSSADVGLPEGSNGLIEDLREHPDEVEI